MWRIRPDIQIDRGSIAVDGAIVTDDNFPNLLLDIAVLRSLNIRTVLVHGAALQCHQLLDDGEAEPGAAGAPIARLIDAEEAIEQLGDNVVGDPWTRV